MDTLRSTDIVDADLPDWRRLTQRLYARFLAGDPASGAAFVADAVRAASEVGFADHLEIGLTSTHVDVRVASRPAGAGLRLHADDVTLARLVSEVARRHEVTSVPGEVVEVELALDTADHARIGPFWAALLTGDADNVADDDSVVDPTGRLPSTWFQGTEPHEPPRQRWHLDVWVAPEAAGARIAGAVAAGGTVVDASEAPSFTVLADPDGNRVCVCTCLDRD